MKDTPYDYGDGFGDGLLGGVGGVFASDASAGLLENWTGDRVIISGMMRRAALVTILPGRGWNLVGESLSYHRPL
jgi:hypothetical protein